MNIRARPIRTIKKKAKTMSETTIQGSPMLDPSIAKAISDIPAEAAEALAFYRAFKTGGFKLAAAELPKLVETTQSTISDAVAAIPALKAGSTTSEYSMSMFALILVALVNIGWEAWRGEIAPPALTLVIGSIPSIYTVVRGFIKTSHNTAAAAVVVAHAP